MKLWSALVLEDAKKWTKFYSILLDTYLCSFMATSLTKEIAENGETLL